MWLLIGIFVVSVYFFLSRGIPRILSWIIIFRYHLNISIGRLTLPYFSFEDVLIKKSSFSIKIEKIRATSSLFNQEERKLFALKIYDVRIEKENTYDSVERDDDDNDSSTEKLFETACFEELSRNIIIEPVLKRVPPSAISLAQFFGIHILGLSMMYFRAKWPECLLHISAEKIILEGSTVNDITVALKVSIVGANIRILQQPDVRNFQRKRIQDVYFDKQVLQHDCSKDENQKLLQRNPSLMECIMTAKLYIEIKSDTWAELEAVSLQLTSPEVVLQERLLSFLEDKAMVIIDISQQTRKKNTITTEQFLHIYWLFLPRKLRFKCDGFNIKFADILGKIIGKGSLQSADLQTHFIRENALDNMPALLPDLSTELQLDNMEVTGLHNTSASISRITLQTQFIGDRINMKTELHKLHGVYDYRDIAVWTKYTTSKKCRIIPPVKKPVYSDVPQTKNRDSPLVRYCIGIIFEVWDICIQATIPSCVKTVDPEFVSCVVVLQHSKQSLVLTQGMSQVAGEIIVESLLCSLGKMDAVDARYCWSSLSIPGPKRSHSYGTAASVGLCILEMSSAISATSSDTLFPLKLEGILDNIQLEWSLIVAFCVTSFIKYFKDLQSSTTQTKTAVKKADCSGEKLRSISVKCSAVNIFFYTGCDVSVMLRVDNICGDKWTSESKMNISGSKCILFTPSGKTYHCLKSSELTNEFLSIRSLGWESSGKEIHINAADELQMIWTMNLHMTILTIVQDVRAFLKDNIESTQQLAAAKTEEHKSNGDLKLQLIAKGNIRFGAQLSKIHRIEFITGDFIYLMSDGIVSVKTDEMKILFDEHEVSLMKGSQLLRLLNSAELRSERNSFSELTLDRNKAWKMVIDNLKLTFPYKYNFAEAFSEEFLSVIKWIKLVHEYKPKEFTVDSPLPPDIMIQVKRFALEVCDDPFEVKLRYNYELMEDEYLESCKRLKALEKKIEETRKTNLQLLSGKINNLFKVLQQKNSETYVKRSKKMYEKEPIRTQLFLWKMENVLIFAMADPSFHGTEKVKKNMKEIDHDSPWPEEGLEFTTLWCRMVSASCSSWKFNLRDYPQALCDIKNMEVYGKLIGAEQKPTKRATRSVPVSVGKPFHSDSVERSLTSLKFYHDLMWEAESFIAAYGPCWEPAVSQLNLTLSLISRPSLDPSKPLPWWDKMRLLFHGRLTLLVDQMTLLLHASLDPYNTTEEMELTWNEMNLDWTNANFVVTGDLNVLVRTASKYDDVRLLNLPNLKISVKLLWVCKGNPNDHHAVMPCAPDKVPEYSINQEHDSYRVFRSQNLKMNLGLETRSGSGNSATAPSEVIFYGSTLRWFENLKFIISGVTRPTRRGILFSNMSPRRPQLSRHYQSVHLSLSFQRFEIKYWMSARVKKGFRFTGERLSLSSEHNLTLMPINDGLKRRSQTCWCIVYLNTELWEAQIWLISAMALNRTQDMEEVKAKRMDNRKESKTEAPKASCSVESPFAATPQLEKFYFLNVTKVAYMRETLEPAFLCFSSLPDPNIRDTPTHRLVVHNLKGVWTTSNRDIVFAVFDSWTKSQQLKRNLAPDIIKSFTPGTTSTPQKPRTWNSSDSGALSPTSILQVPSAVQNTPSPRARLQSDHTSAMLQQLIAEADNNYIAYAEDCSTPEPRDFTLQGIKAACTTEDIIHKKWLIQLVNSQVLLKGPETQGYVIISAAQSQISQRIHRPTWQDHTLATKTTWTGSLECMQYYATVSEGNEETEMDNIMWLTVDNIVEKDSTVINEVTDIVGSGQSVGGVVSQTVGTCDAENESVQLQRIVSRCRCEFFYVSYGETGLDPTLLEEVQPASHEEGLWNNSTEAADTFTLMHYDLCASTNYLQYNMVVDILNNLLLYMDPNKKEFSEALARMRFKLQLYSTEDQRKPIVQLQNQVRYHLSQLRFLEKEVYMIQRQMDREPTSDLIAQKNDLEAQAAECKEKVNSLGEELSMRIHCYNETQLSSNHKLAASKGDKKSLIRMNEVYFRKAQWKLTDADGQLGIAQLDLSNFLYSKKTFSDDIAEHLLELGFINVCNLLPNQIYKDVLAPAELKSTMPVDRQKTLRIYCREKPPCGGISILEHFEINVVPLKIEFTYQFFKTMLKFCFPYNNTEEDADSGLGSKGEKTNPSLKKSQKVSNFYVDLKKDDVEIMKQRAEQNKHFVFIKIPELPVNLSYKGKKEKNIEDVHSYHLVIPTMEYHSVTWTWLDLLLAVKMSSKSALLSQAIKHKLNIGHFRADEASTPTEEDKARLLLGNKYMQQQQHQSETKGNKKSLFKFHR